MKLSAFIVYTVLITFASLSPTGTVDMGESDKIYHFVAYIVFAVLAAGVAKSSNGYAVICLGIVCYSGLLEVVQSLIPGRFMSGYDLLANVIGVTTGYLVMQRILRVARSVAL